MNEVFQKTRELGEAIMRSEEYRHMKEMETNAMRNPDTASAMGQFIECRQEIEALLKQSDPDTIRLKKLSDRLDELQERLQTIDDIQKLTDARSTFSGLIEQVNKVLKFIITGDMDTSETEEGGCPSGACGSCGGCSNQLN